MADPLRLPPFPDELLEASRKPDVIRMLRWLGVPDRTRRALLQRWGEYVGVPLEASDYALLSKGS